jgi:hypothetical protein
MDALLTARLYPQSMGLFDILKGKTKLRQPTEDRLFAMATAYVPMEEQGLTPTGKAAMVFQPLGTSDFESIVSEMTELLDLSGGESGTKVTTSDDSFGYRWMVVADPEFEDLVVSLNTVNGALRDGGYADRVLAALFAFRDERGKPMYWIYNVKRAAYYPFVPGDGPQTRDSERELRLKARHEADLPVEADLSRWFPLWEVPL